MSWPLRQSTAGQEIPLGPFVDAGDAVTSETGLTITNTDIKLFKTGATALVSKNSAGATHMADGDFYAVLDATDTNTLGPMRVRCYMGGALRVWLDCEVLTPQEYDARFGAAGYVNMEAAGVREFRQTAQAYAAATITTADDSTAAPGDFVEITSAGYVQMGQVTAAAASVAFPDALELTIDPPFSPSLSGTIVYTVRIGARNPETNKPQVNAAQVGGEDQAAVDLGSAVETIITGVNVSHINDTLIQGSGVIGDKFRGVP
jgi:hypothetical protein